MKILEVLRIKKYLGIAAASAAAIFFFYAYTQVLGIVENLDLWFTVIPPQNLALFSIFSILFGITLSYQLYLRTQPKTCAIKKQSVPGTLGTIWTFFVAQCPACASLGVLFLPVSVIGFLTAFSLWINLASIALLLFTLFMLGAFRKA